MNRSSRNAEADEAESTYTKAAKAELAKKYDIAFGLYIKSAEIFLHLTRANGTLERDKSRWKGKASQALERAEKIKATINTTPSLSSGPAKQVITPSSSLSPVGVDHFSHREQTYVLRKGSVVNGLIFPLWDDEPETLTVDADSFDDPDGQPSLSPEQLQAATIWRRPDDVDYSRLPVQQLRAEDIVQHTVTDCSVCAAVSVCLEHGRRFHSALIRNTLYYTVLSGRCDVKFLFNGAWRRIDRISVIDDKLPRHPTSGMLMCMTCRTQGALHAAAWPSHVEKAYMKLMGGYDFPGSNSSIDLHALGGWIPEQVEIKSSNFERESTWTRIHNGFLRGHCMLTLGTGAQSKIRWGSTRLLSSHDYAVIDVLEDEKERTLTVLDSWVPMTSSQQESRTLQIPWSDALVIFEGIYLSWDPQLWKNTLTFHGTWSKRENASGCNHETCAGFRMTDDSLEEAEIWVLLTRHITNTRDASQFVALSLTTEDEDVISPVQKLKVLEDRQGVYTNSAHVLAKCRISKAQPSGILNIHASYDGSCRNPSFTLKAYAPEGLDIAWETAFVKPPFSSQLEDKLTHKTAGGNPEFPSFMINPQYLLRVHGPPRSRAQTSLSLETLKDLPVNISVLWSHGERIFDLSEKDMVATSGAYRYGSARIACQLTPGDYNVVVSAFEPQKTGTFILSVKCFNKFEIAKLPQEGAGMYCKTIKGAWEGPTAAGGPGSKQYMRNPIYELDCASPTQVKIRLQLAEPGSSAPLNVTLLAATNVESKKRTTTSGAYDDSMSGVVTPLVSLDRGKYWVIPSTYSPGVQASFQLMVYSSVLHITVRLKDGLT